MKRNIGVDFGTSSSVLCYCDYDGDSVGEVKFVKFENGDKDFVPTIILKAGSLTDGSGKSHVFDEEFGWKAYHRQNAYPLQEQHFKMGLVSSDEKERSKAEELTKKFFAYLYNEYNKIYTDEKKKGKTIDEVHTYITYPAKFPDEVRKFLVETAEDAGFPNVEAINEAQAAMAYAVSFDSGETKAFFEKHPEPSIIEIVDMGGGTSDIVIFKFDPKEPKTFEPLAFYPEQGGATFGGSEIDKILCDFYKSAYGEKVISGLGGGNAEYGEKILSMDVRVFKEQVLSPEFQKDKENKEDKEDKENKENKKISDVPGRLFLYKPEKNTDLNRKSFENLLAGYMPQFSELMHGALEKAGIEGSEIDLVLLTGRHSQWYFVREILQNNKDLGLSKIQEDSSRIISFPKPHLVVAQGAALYPFCKAIEPAEEEEKTEDLAQEEQQSIIDVEPDYVVAKGKIGKSIKWQLKKSGRLIFSGKGAITSEYKYGFPSGKEVKHIVVGEGITRIEDDAFKCSYARYITLPESLTYIGRAAFMMSDLETITIPGSVTEVGEWAFKSCDELQLIVMPDRFDKSVFYKGLNIFSPLESFDGFESHYGIDKNKVCFYNAEIPSVNQAKIPSQNTSFYTWDDAGTFSEGYAAVKKNDEWGYVDNTGKLVIPCIWDKAGYFSEGVAVVKKNDKWGYIDKSGELIIPCTWDGAGSFREDLACVKKNDKWGYIDKSDEFIIPCEWDCAETFSEGLACVKKNNKYGYINKSGELIIPCTWDDASWFREGLAYVKKNGKYGYIDKSGELIIPCRWDDASWFREGLAYVKKNGKYGYIDKSGELVIPCIWDNAWYFSEGLAAVSKYNKWVYIYKSGALSIIGTWNWPDSFSEGLAGVEKHGKKGYIDVHDKMIIPCTWDNAWHFSEGLARVMKNGKCIHIDKTGKPISALY